MVSRKIAIILIFIIILALTVFFFIVRSGDIYKIKKNLNTLASLVEKSENETVIMTLAKVQKISSFFSQDCQIDIGNPVPPIRGKDELIGISSQLLQLVDNVEIKLTDISIILEDKTHAQSTFIVAVIVSSSLLDKNEIYPRQLEIIWEKIDGDWKINSAKVIEVLH